MRIRSAWLSFWFLMSGINQHPTDWPVSDPGTRESTWPQAIVKTIKCQVFVMSLFFFSQILRESHCSVLWGDANVNICWRSNPRLRSICNSNPLYLYLLLSRLPAYTWYGDCKILASLFVWGKLQLTVRFGGICCCLPCCSFRTECEWLALFGDYRDFRTNREQPTISGS